MFGSLYIFSDLLVIYEIIFCDSIFVRSIFRSCLGDVVFLLVWKLICILGVFSLIVC